MKYKYNIPDDVYKKFGPFDEFKQDASFVTVELSDGRKFSGVLVLYPNFIIAMEGFDEIPFDPSSIVRVCQTGDDLKKRSSSDWTFWIEK